MNDEHQEPHVFHLLQGEALDIHRSPTGHVGRVFCGEGLEAVWVAKQQEGIDTAWFCQPTVDLLIILQGQLRVEFEQTHQASVVLGPGDLLVLPPRDAVSGISLASGSARGDDLSRCLSSEG